MLHFTRICLWIKIFKLRHALTHAEIKDALHDLQDLHYERIAESITAGNYERAVDASHHVRKILVNHTHALGYKLNDYSIIAILLLILGLFPMMYLVYAAPILDLLGSVAVLVAYAIVGYRLSRWYIIRTFTPTARTHAALQQFHTRLASSEDILALDHELNRLADTVPEALMASRYIDYAQDMGEPISVFDLVSLRRLTDDLNKKSTR